MTSLRHMEGVEIQLHVLLSSVLDANKRSASRPSRFISGNRGLGKHCRGSWVDPRDDMDTLELPLLGIESKYLPSSNRWPRHYTYWAIAASTVPCLSVLQLISLNCEMFTIRSFSVSSVGLGEFAKLRKATISFVMSVRLSSVHMEQLGYHWTDFH
jgi:hypothetical protein